jgi:hypothetical protein
MREDTNAETSIMNVYRVIQEKRSIFLEVIVQVIVRKKFAQTCVLILIGY